MAYIRVWQYILLGIHEITFSLGNIFSDKYGCFDQVI